MYLSDVVFGKSSETARKCCKEILSLNKSPILSDVWNCKICYSNMDTTTVTLCSFFINLYINHRIVFHTGKVRYVFRAKVAEWWLLYCPLNGSSRIVWKLLLTLSACWSLSISSMVLVWKGGVCLLRNVTAHFMISSGSLRWRTTPHP